MTKSIYEFQISDLLGKSNINFANFRGKKILLVNTASECGYTPQYAQLQELYENFHSQLVIIGCPSNDFGQQEPGTAPEIQHFCRQNYGVNFPLTGKINVKVGDNQHPLYQWLYQQSGKAVSWNFCKYLVNEQGKLSHFFASGIDPISETMLAAIENMNV